MNFANSLRPNARSTLFSTVRRQLACAGLALPVIPRVICCDQSHVETDECGAPEFFSNGSKLLVAPSTDGKLTRSPFGNSPPSARIFISQAPRCHAYAIHRDRPCLLAGGVGSHRGRMQGPRALSAHGRRALCQCLREPRLPACRNELEKRRGCFVLWRNQEWHGCRRSGLFFDRKLATDFDYRCKQAGQLASKMRFLSAPWVECWRAAHGCAMLPTQIVAPGISLHRLTEFRPAPGQPG